MQLIIKYFEQELEKCKRNTFSKQEDLDFLDSFNKKYDFKKQTIMNITNLKCSDMMIIILYLEKQISIAEAKIQIAPIKDLLDNIDLNLENTKEFINYIENIYNVRKVKIKQSNKKKSPFQNPQFLQFIENIDNFQIFNLFITFILIKYCCKQKYNSAFDKNNPKLPDEMLQEIQKADSYTEFYNSVFIKLQKEIKNLRKLKNNDEENNQKMINAYKEILNEINKPGIIGYNSSFSQISEELQKELMIAINLHNERIYTKISQEYLNMKNNPDYLKKLFHSYGYDMTKLSEQNIINLLTYGDTEKIKKLLPIIKEKPFSMIETDYAFVRTLLFSNEMILDKIKDYCNKNILSESFIRSFPDILISNEYKSRMNIYYSYETLINNIDYLLSKNFNVMNIRKTNPNLLTLENNLLKIYITRLEKYNINFENQKNNDYRYLSLSQTLNVIDGLIELGLSEYIKDNIEELIPNGALIIKRIYIAKKIGMNIFDENNKLNSSITKGYNFLVADKDLDDYILNATKTVVDKTITFHFDNLTYEITPIINLLDSKFLQGENYLFDNIIISRNKVIRNLSSVTTDFNDENIYNILLNAIIYNSILESDEINIISKQIQKLIERNKTKLKN